MKKFFLILTLLFFTGISLHAQEDTPNDDQGTNRLQDKMREYIQKRLNLNRAEAEKFSPVFIRYMLELRKTHREFQNDVPMRQLEIAKVRVRFRDEFRQVLDEKRADRVFECQREFEQAIKQTLIDRRNGPGGGIRRNRAMQF